MTAASAPSTEAPGTSLAQQIILQLRQPGALILLTGHSENACTDFLDNLVPALQGSGHPINLRPPHVSATLFVQIAASLGLEDFQASAASLAKYLAKRNIFLLCPAENYTPDFFEQVRQLSNIHPQDGSFGIVLCGTKALRRRLPATLRQRITATYRLDAVHHNPVRRLAWVSALIALGMGALLASRHLPAWVNSITARPPAATPPRFMLENSLKAGPVLMQPPPVSTPSALSHVFETEAEAEAALQRETPALKPARQ